MNNKEYRPLPFWSWNEELDENRLISQIHWMHDNGIGGFFMHARGGLTTQYLSEKWFSCIDACMKEADKLGMCAYAYDENGWPSGFCGGELLKDENNKDCYVSYDVGEYNSKSTRSYEFNKPHNIVKSGEKVINVYINRSSSTVDICQKEVVKQFLNSTHEKYAKLDKNHLLKGFFTDEPQYYRQKVPFTYALESYFKQEYHDDVYSKLYLLFLEEDGYEEFRYRYYKALNYLITHNFGEQVYMWCDSHGYELTGHYIEEKTLAYQMMCCADIMPLYEYEHIPGIDWLSRDIGLNDLCPRQVASIAAQLNKPQVIAEIFAMTGWDASPRDYKHIADWLFVGGINVICQHLLPYSERGDRKRDYPAHFSKFNPWINEGFKEFNDYYASLGKKLGQSKEEVHTLVFHPIRSCYFYYKRDRGDINFGIDDLEKSLNDTLNLLGENHISYHFLNETIFQKYGSIKDNKIVIGNCSYEYLIFPKVVTMDKETEVLVSKFIRSGGKVLFMDEKPSYLEGQKHTYNYDSNVTIEDIKLAQSFTSSINKNIRISHRYYNNDDFYFVVNLGDKTSCIINGSNFDFEKYESKIIKNNDFEIKSNKNKKVISFPKKFKIVEPVNNYLKLDNLMYSKDGINYEGPLNYMHVFARLIKEKYNGELFLKYNFVNKDFLGPIDVIIEDSNTLCVFINDVEVFSNKVSEFEPSMKIYSIKNLKIGTNSIVVKMNFFESETVYRVWYDKTILENIKNSLVYDSNIESIYLRGKFGVYCSFEDGKDNRLMLGKDFYLSNQQDFITDFINDGFPFFKGKIRLTSNLNLDLTDVVLKLPEHYQVIDISINGEHIAKTMFDTFVQLENVRIGDNTLLIDYVVSNRNILGPNHQTVQESYSIGPSSWERIGRWDNEGFDDWIDEYAFVKPIY